jgi:hypothetical protein
MSPKPKTPNRCCRPCEHYSGRITGEFGACLKTGEVRAPFDLACEHYREADDGYPARQSRED